MYKKFFLIFLFGFIFLYSFGNKFDMKFYLDSTKKESNEKFALQFPYKNYLSKIFLENIGLIESHRKMIKSFGRNDTAFLRNLFRTYWESDSLDVNNFSDMCSKIQLGIFYFRLGDSICEGLYENRGAFLLSKYSERVEKAILCKELDKNAAETRILLEMLGRNQYLIRVPISNWEKIILNIKLGKWSYIFGRAKMWISDNPIKFSVILIFGLTFGFFLIRFFIRKIFKKKVKLVN